MTGEMNRRPIFYNWTTTPDLRGGPTEVETERWNQWAKIDDRSGNTYAAEATELTRYDYRVEIFFDRRFNSNTRMIYEGQVCKCESYSIQSEGYRNKIIARFSKTDTFVDQS